MKAISKLVIAVVAVGFVLGTYSCNKHTCPTYSQAEAKKEIRA